LPISEVKKKEIGVGPKERTEAAERWKNTTFTKLEGIWGQYLAVKVKKVFPKIETLGLPEFPAVSRESTRHLLKVSKVRRITTGLIKNGYYCRANPCLLPRSTLFISEA
jgi:hypothetical protein